ncbi:ABC-2 transporter permease [Rhodopirellula sallentina]|uniref:Signal peptide protein n=1 Tax=Rhodopirellula sallentina SM41 TaxID=1263870 RepID=M5UAZ9_9BACT|nr:ABC-2 transporter permease [Rhodopirellula sallentina]EMI53168.1 signal peptide protein [Rhodopirellula sallentina SM41]
MNETRVWQGLLWKETKQILPLIGILFAVSTFLVIVWTTTSRQVNISLRTVGDIVPLIMPALFAAGAGAILISHEKETRSLRWLASLPIPWQPIVVTKLVVAFAGLVLMWIGCGFLGAVAGLNSSGGGGFSEWRQIHPAFWFLHSIYVLLCGFYTAWRNKNAFAALVLIIPFALLPFVIAEVWMALPHTSPVQYASVAWRTWVMGMVTSLAIPVVGWLSYRAGRSELQADEPEKLLTRDALSSADAWRPPDVSAPTVMPFRDSHTSMVWQSIHGSPWMSIGLSVPLFFGVIGWLVLTNCTERLTGWTETAVGTGIGTALLAVSWLGVAVFAGDGSATRLKFLADRGVSPGRVWLGRHWLGVSLLCGVALVILAIQSFLGTASHSDTYHRAAMFELSFLSILLVFVVIYGVSQWTSQVVPMLAASAFLAPVLSLVALALLINAGVVNGVRLSWLLLVASLPFVSTFLLMKDFMDGRRGWKYWSMVGVAASVFMVAPSVPVWIAKSRFPSMTEDRFAVLFPEARQLSDSVTTRPTSMRYGDLDLRDALGNLPGEIDGEIAVQRFEQRDYMSPDTWMAIGDRESVPLLADVVIVQHGLEAASLAKLRWQQWQDDATQEELVAFVDHLSLTARRLRLSYRWYDQEVADVVEIWLVDLLSDDAISGLRSRAGFQNALRQVGDFEGRQRARRRAMLISWYRDQTAPHGRRGGIHGVSAMAFWFDDVPSGWRSSIMVRGLGAVTDRCLKLLDAGQAGKGIEAELRDLDQLVGEPGGEFKAGPYGDMFASEGGSAVHAWNWSYPSYPATNWFEPWEREGLEMFDEYSGEQVGDESSLSDSLLSQWEVVR